MKDISIKIELIVKKGTIYPMWLRLIIVTQLKIEYRMHYELILQEAIFKKSIVLLM